MCDRGALMGKWLDSHPSLAEIATVDAEDLTNVMCKKESFGCKNNVLLVSERFWNFCPLVKPQRNLRKIDPCIKTSLYLKVTYWKIILKVHGKLDFHGEIDQHLFTKNT